MPFGQSASLHLDDHDRAIVTVDRATAANTALAWNLNGLHENALVALRRVADVESLAAIASAAEWLAAEARSVMYERSPLRVELVPLPDDIGGFSVHGKATDRVIGSVS